MVLEKELLEKYEKPIVEIVEFTIEESIATSAGFGASTVCTEINDKIGKW